MTLPARFVKKFSLTVHGCWIWTAGLSVGGYAKFSQGQRTVLGHRYAYEHTIGPIPEGLVIDHLCRNRSCVNPAHMEPVTPGENVRRGDLPAQVAARNRLARDAGACVRGHAFDESNTYWHNGKRQCKTCKADRCRRYRLTREKQQ